MRPLILLCTTLAAVAMIGYADAGGTLIKKEDVPKAIETLKKGSSAARGWLRGPRMSAPLPPRSGRGAAGPEDCAAAGAAIMAPPAAMMARLEISVIASRSLTCGRVTGRGTRGSAPGADPALRHLARSRAVVYLVTTGSDASRPVGVRQCGA